ncbi:hypothetical protein BRADI_5g27511v3 [Brachypodium distachyon]|uniref:DUF6598 domain-containing protein n=1 Tax=Brachypodium distachyon TaxID=15368 RepID=A0A2K2CJN8_BRADI|nr:hypothetical protein BRADI_5g27511v3 [Brachypodium distachyon]
MDANEVVLLDSRGELPMGTDGHIDLSRRVVSVEINPGHENLEGLKVVLEAYSESGRGIAAQGDVMFKPKLCNISQATCDLIPQKEEATCDLGGYQVEITVAWSVSASSRTYF